MDYYKKYKILYGSELTNNQNSINDLSLLDVYNSSLINDIPNNDYFTYNISFKNFNETHILNNNINSWIVNDNGCLKNNNTSSVSFEILLNAYNIVLNSTPFDYDGTLYSSTNYQYELKYSKSTTKNIGAVNFGLKSNTGKPVYAKISFDNKTYRYVTTSSTTYEYFTIKNPVPQFSNQSINISIRQEADGILNYVYLKDIYLLEATSYTTRHPIPSGKTPFDKIYFKVSSCNPTNNVKISFEKTDATLNSYSNDINEDELTSVTWSSTPGNTYPDILKITLGPGDSIRSLIISGMNTYK